MEKLKELGQSVTGMKRKMATWAKGVALKGNMNLEKGYVHVWIDSKDEIFKINAWNCKVIQSMQSMLVTCMYIQLSL